MMQGIECRQPTIREFMNHLIQVSQYLYKKSFNVQNDD